LLYIIIFMMAVDKIKKLYLALLVVFILLFLSSCQNNIIIPNPIIDNTMQKSFCLNIKENNGIIKDCTPEFEIICEKENISAMSFSSSGEDWSEWVKYSENYAQFNIASGLYGTKMESGAKTVYVRFKDTNGDIFPQDFQDPVCCEFEYEMQKLFTISIEPYEVEVKPGGNQTFIVKGYDLFSENEVPLDGNKIEWSKPCAVGKLTPVSGLKTTYTAPENIGTWNISAQYGTLGTGAKVYVLEE
jgi:hypothetical protein